MVYKNNKRAVKRNKQRKRLFISFLVLCLVVLAVFVYVMRIEALQIQTISVVKNQFVQTETIVAEAQTSLLGNRVFVIPKSNTIFLSKKDIARELTKRFTEIESLKITRNGLTGLEIDVKERDASYTLCQTENCYYLDRTGVVFKIIEGKAQEGAPIFTSNKTYSIGEIYLNEQIISELGILVDSISGKGLEIVTIEEYSEFTMALITRQGTRLLLPKTTSYDELYSLLVKLLNTESFKVSKDTKDFKVDYAYINLQFGKKIFSCVSGEVCAVNYR